MPHREQIWRYRYQQFCHTFVNSTGLLSALPSESIVWLNGQKKRYQSRKLCLEKTCHLMPFWLEVVVIPPSGELIEINSPADEDWCLMYLKLISAITKNKSTEIKAKSRLWYWLVDQQKMQKNQSLEKIKQELLECIGFNLT